MPNDLEPAVAAMQRYLDEQLQGVAETKRMINKLLQMSGQAEMYPESESEHSGYVRSDQFYGKGVATASAEYLAIRKQACQPDEILNALHSGGFDFSLMGWREDDRLRSLAISLAKNTGAAGKFHRLPNGSFGLRIWYDKEFLEKAAAGAPEEKVKKTRNTKGRRKAPKGAKPSPLKSTSNAKTEGPKLEEPENGSSDLNGVQEAIV